MQHLGWQPFPQHDSFVWHSHALSRAPHVSCLLGGKVGVDWRDRRWTADTLMFATCQALHATPPQLCCLQ